MVRGACAGGSFPSYSEGKGLNRAVDSGKCQKEAAWLHDNLCSFLLGQIECLFFSFQSKKFLEA